MATGAWSISSNYRLWIGITTTTGTKPTNSTGLTEVLSLTDVPFTGATSTTNVRDYQSDLGAEFSPVTQTSFTFAIQLNLDNTSAGYKLFHQAWRESASGTALKLWRETPVVTGTSGAAETYAAIVQVTDIQESIPADGTTVRTLSITLKGLGSPTFTAQGSTTGVIATLTATANGTGLTAGTAIPLVGGSGYGATATITVSSGAVATVTVVAGGANYVVGDRLTIIQPSIIGTGTMPTFSVATLV